MLIKHTINCQSVYVKPLGIMVNIIGNPCYNTKFVHILIKQKKIQIRLKQVRQGVFVLLNEVYTHPVKWIRVLFVVLEKECPVGRHVTSRLPLTSTNSAEKKMFILPR